MGSEQVNKGQLILSCYRHQV